MKSIYLRNFAATATMVSVCFLLIAFSFVFIGRNYIISEYRSDMEASAKEVSRAASAISAGDDLSSFALSMSLSSISNATGNHIFITNSAGYVANCSDRAPVCRHLGMKVPEETIAQIESTGYINQMSSFPSMYPDSRYTVALPILDYSSQSNIGGDNFISFRNNELDKLIVDLRREFDMDKRIKMNHRIEKLIHEEQPYTFLFCFDSLVAVSSQFKNIKLYPNRIYPISFYWQEDEKNE